MEAKPRWRTWAEPLRRDGRNGRETRPRFTGHAKHHADHADANGSAGATANGQSQLQPDHSTLLDCCIATGGVALALLLRRAIEPICGPTVGPFITFYFAIVAAAWFGGALPGLLSIVLSALAGWYFFLHRLPASSVGAIGAFVHVMMFCGVGLIGVALTEAYRAALRRAENSDEAAQLYQDEIRQGATDRANIERALRAAEDRYRRVIDSNIAGVITCDTDGAITHANDAFLRMLGYTREAFDAHRPTWRDLTPTECSDADLQALAELEANGTCAPYEKEYLHHDGRTRVPVMVAGLRLDPPEPGGIGFVVDLSPLSKARHTLHLQSRVLETMAEGVFVDDMFGNIAFVNPALEHMFGYEPGELIGQRVSILHTADGADWKDLLEEIRLALRVRGQWTGELEHRRKDGSSFLASAHVRAMQNADENEYWVCVVEDVTQRRATQRAIHEAEDRLSMAMAAASMGAWELDPRTDQLTASANVRALLAAAGSDPQRELISMEEFYATLHTDDQARVRQAVHDALDGTHDYDVEFRGVNSAGDTRWLAARAKVFRDEFGHPLRMTGVTMDITDRRAAEYSLRESEERFRLAADAVAALIYDWDMKTGTVLRTSGLTKILGYIPDDVGANEQWWRDQIHPDDLPDAVRRFDRAVANDEPGFSVEYRVRHQDGHWVHVWDRCSLMRETDGREVTRILGSIVDVTELKRAQLELQAAKEIAESADRAKDQFLAVLSHELRTPLAPVLGAVQLLLANESLPEQARDDLDMIRRNVELEARLIDDLLDLTRVARGKVELQMHPCDTHLAIRRVVEMCQPEVANKSLQLSLDLAAPRSVIVADAARLQQIVWNLVQNAMKFTPEGRQITVRTVVDERDRLLVHVIDTGIGIAADSLQRIFDAFEQVSRDVTRRFGGLGLGLAISKKLTDLQGGDLKAESAGIDQGATFTLSFPLAPVEHAAAPTEPTEPHPVADEQVALSDNDGLRILLVEDHADTAMVIARLLRANHYQVQTAGSVADALELASREPFDLIISDLGLPDGSGHDLMQQLLQRLGPVKGIALTGFGMESDLDRSREAGFRDHLTKPIDMQRLEASIQRVVQAEQHGALTQSAPAVVHAMCTLAKIEWDVSGTDLRAQTARRLSNDRMCRS